jgi:hypothetical protein
MDSHSDTLFRTEGIPFKPEVYHLNDATIMIGTSVGSLPDVARPLRLALPRAHLIAATLPCRATHLASLAPCPCLLRAPPRLLLLALATPPIGQPLDWPRWLRMLRLCVGLA